MPEINGQIGYFKLTGCWLSAFTQEERGYIESVYKPMRVGDSQQAIATISF